MNTHLWMNIRLWDVVTGHHKKIIEGHASVDSTVAFSPDGKTIAIGGTDSVVLLWDITSILNTLETTK